MITLFAKEKFGIFPQKVIYFHMLLFLYLFSYLFMYFIFFQETTQNNKLFSKNKIQIKLITIIGIITFPL